MSGKRSSSSGRAALRKPVLFGLDVQLPDQSCIEIRLAGDVSLKLGAAYGIGIERLRGELRFDLRREQGRTEPIDQLRDRLFRRLRRCDQAEPHVGFEISITGFRYRWQIRQRLDPLQ